MHVNEAVRFAILRVDWSSPRGFVRLPPAKLNEHLGASQTNMREILERRRLTRYILRLPVHFEYLGRDGVRDEGNGFTREISLQGVYVYTESLPPADAEIDLDIYFTSLLETNKNVKFMAKAKVIRLEPSAVDERTGGFASVTGYFTLFNGVAHHP
jgi:hypothetical protein